MDAARGRAEAVTAGQVLLFVVALAAFGLAARRGMTTAQRALREAGQNILRVLPLLLVAMPMAAFLAELIPPDIASAWLGPESGVTGIVVASLAGGFIPGGPFVSFPLVLTFMKAGAGPAQMVALITGWAILGFHRVIAWEWPVLGARFVAIRLVSSILLPVLAGVLALALLTWFPQVLPRP